MLKLLLTNLVNKLKILKYKYMNKKNEIESEIEE